MGVFYEFDEVESFGVGAIGEPGKRVFYLQARQGSLQLDIKCEKRQVAAIAEYLRKVLNDLPVPEPAPVEAGISQPVNAAFVLGPVGLGYNREHDRVMLQFDEIEFEDDEEDDDTDTSADADSLDRGHLRVFISRAQAHAFCNRADELVAAGRPLCRWCEGPLDPSGHVCPRMN